MPVDIPAASERATAVPDAAAAYALGKSPAETARLRSQAAELRPYAAALLDHIGPQPGQHAIDLGCGPCGILDLLSAAVSPGGRVVGLDADPAHTAMARQYASERGLGDIETLTGDARRTGFPPGSFDLVHARMLLMHVLERAEVVTEMVRLTAPGGWVASQEPDCEFGLCYPPLPEWDRLHELLAGFRQSGADPLMGRRLTGLYRDAGLEDVGMQAHAPVCPPGSAHRPVVADLVRRMRPRLLESGLSDEREFDELDRAVRTHLADPHTEMIPHLLIAAWGRKPGP